MEGGGDDEAGRFNRITEFKNKGKDEESQRGKRREYAVELRKADRASQLVKKRNMDALGVNQDISEIASRELMRPPPQLEELPEIVSQLMDDSNPEGQVRGLIRCRRILSKQENPPIDAFISRGVVPKTVELMKTSKSPKVQFEAAWVITNIASGSSLQTHTVVESQAIPVLLELLASPHTEVREQAVWALGNIVGDGPQLRDYVLGLRGMELVLQLLEREDRLTVMRNAAWTLSNFCRFKNPPPDFRIISQCLPRLQLLLVSNDDQILSDAAWAVAYISDGDAFNRHTLIINNFHGLLSHLLTSRSADIILPVLRTYGNIAAGNQEETQHIIDLNVLPHFNTFLMHDRDAVRKEAAWVLSNIAAGTPAQIQTLFVQPDLLPTLVDLARGGEFKVRREATWALANIACKGTPQQVNQLVAYNCIPVFINMLSAYEPRSPCYILDSIRNLLTIGKTEDGNLYTQAIEEAHGVEKIEALLQHDNEQISRTAAQIMEDFFNRDIQGLAPNVRQGGFEFNANSAPQGGFHF